MGRKQHEIGKLCFTDPEAAAEKMRAVFVAHGGSSRGAASSLGCTRWTFKRWIRSLGLEEEFREVRDILWMRGGSGESAKESGP